MTTAITNARYNKWSVDNHIDLKSYGSINFPGKSEASKDFRSQFIRFNPQNDPSVEAIYDLLISQWKFSPPELIISMNGGLKNMKIENDQSKTEFKQGLIEIMKHEKTWIISGGFNVGVDKLVSDAVQEYRHCHDVENDNRVMLIGIGTWGVVENNRHLVTEECDADQESPDYRREYLYQTSDINLKGQAKLDMNCDCFLFCDDGSSKVYDRETDFRRKFENYLRWKSPVTESGSDQCTSLMVQILFEGGKRSIANVYKSLCDSIPVVIFKGSRGVADLICEMLELNKRNYEKNMYMLLKKNESYIRLNCNDIETYKPYISEMYKQFKKQIFVHGRTNSKTRLVETVLEALISSHKDFKLEKLLDLSIRFDCLDIAQNDIFRDPKFLDLQEEVLKDPLMRILAFNKPEFLQLFLENNLNIEKFLSYEDLIMLYQKSVFGGSSRCGNLLWDLCLSTNLYGGDLRFTITGILNNLSLSIIHKIKIPEEDQKNKTQSLYQNKILDTEIEMDRVSLLNLPKLYPDIKFQDLFLWALVSGYTEMAVQFWKVGVNYTATALVGSIILNSMIDRSSNMGDRELSIKLTDTSRQFEDMACAIVNVAYDENQSETEKLLESKLETWSGMSTMDISMHGKMLEFLNTSACQIQNGKLWENDFKRSDSSKIKRIKKFIQSPKAKFIAYLIYYIIFLFVFGYLNMVELKPLNKGKILKDISAEIVVYLYVFCFTFEEIRQMFFEEGAKFRKKMAAYFRQAWNVYDWILVAMFFTSTTLRFSLESEYFAIVRCSFAVTFSMFCLRVIQFYLISRYIGRKVIMLKEMMFDILFFLSLFGIFIISYGTLFQTIKFPNEAWDSSLLKNILYNPYFQSYGELMLENFHMFSNCNSTSCAVQSSTIIVGFALFMFMTNILLVNLLIAIFGCTFTEIERKANSIFPYIQIKLIKEMEIKCLLPPPFNIIYNLISDISFYYHTCWNTKPEKKFHADEVFERKHMENSIQNLNNNSNSNNNNLLLFSKKSDNESEKRAGGSSKNIIKSAFKPRLDNIDNQLYEMETKFEKRFNEIESKLNLILSYLNKTESV